MPTITTPPVQVSTDPEFRQSRSELNPFSFQVGAQLYQVLVAAQDVQRRLGVFKRATADVGGAWVRQDDAGTPDAGNQLGYLYPVFDSNTGIIRVFYILTSDSLFHYCDFDTNTDTWGTPSPGASYGATSGAFNRNFIAYQKSNSDFVGVFSTSTNLYYFTVIANAWSGVTVLLGSGATHLYDGFVDGSDNFYFLLVETSAHLNWRIIDPSFGISAFHTFTSTLDFVAARPAIIQVDSTTAAVGYEVTDGLRALIATVITNFNTVPVYTPNTIAIPATTEALSYATFAIGLDGKLNAFYVRLDYIVDPIVDQLEQSVFDGANWVAGTVYYDATANPPSDTVPDPLNQFIHTAQPIELPQGWSMATTMETIDGDDNQWCTGFFMDPESSPPAQTLQLNKTVIGGNKIAADFILTATGSDSPATVVTGPGPQVGPTAVPAITFDLSEAFGPTWNDATGTWSSNSSPWNGGYVASAWVCTGGGTMPNDHTIIIPAGANIVCTIVNTAPIPPIPPQPGSPCGGPVTPQPQTDVQFELRRVYASMKPAPRLPIRGS